PKFIDFEVTQLILSSNKNAIEAINRHRPHNRIVGQRIENPMITIKNHQAFVISEVHNPIGILIYAPVLQSTLIHLVRIINDLMYGDRTLRKNGRTTKGNK